MREARESGQSKTDWALLRQNVIDDIEPEDDADSPDATLFERHFSGIEKYVFQQHVNFSADDEAKTFLMVAFLNNGTTSTRFSAPDEAKTTQYLTLYYNCPSDG